MPNKTGERIKIAREAKRMSQEELGKVCGITKQTIYKYETGIITNIPLDKLESIAEALDVSAVYLAGWKDETGAEKTAAEEGDGLSPLEKRLMQLVHRLSDDQKEMLLAQIELLLSKQG